MMSRATAIGLALAAFALGAIVGVLVFTWTVGGSGEPSEPISAPTLSLNPTADAPGSVAEELAQIRTNIANLSAAVAALSENADDDSAIMVLATEVAQLREQIDGLGLEAATTPVFQVITPTPMTAEQPTATIEESTQAEAALPRALYRIAADQSEVRFILNEELRGTPTVVTGITNEVAGDVIVDFANPADSQIGTIRINARTLATDSEMRNRTIRSQILQSSRDEYEFIDFVPTAISGLPESAAVGDTFTIQITGDLTIRNISHPVTFDATITLVSDTEISGSAQATVLRSDYNLEIPSVPGVANVTDDVTLEFDFVALKTDE